MAMFAYRWPGTLMLAGPVASLPARKPDQVLVYFFGTHKRAWVSKTNLVSLAPALTVFAGVARSRAA